MTKYLHSIRAYYTLQKQLSHKVLYTMHIHLIRLFVLSMALPLSLPSSDGSNPS